MNILKSLKKKKVPEELPDLASDEIEKDTEEVNQYLQENEKRENSKGKENKRESEDFEHIEAPDESSKENLNKQKEESNAEKTEMEESNKEMEEKISKLTQNMPKEESFFEKLESEISNEVTDLDKLQEWYEKKISGNDIVSDMKDYWENQKNQTMLVKILGRDYQKKIIEKTSQLQKLEKEWQERYFELIEKEEEMKDVEKDLKKILGEFMDICKKRKSGEKKTQEKSKKKSGKK